MKQLLKQHTSLRFQNKLFKNEISSFLTFWGDNFSLDLAQLFETLFQLFHGDVYVFLLIG
jgi:hypothetical protein